jgi:hypothetical protein
VTDVRILPQTPSQHRLWFLNAFNPDHSGYHVIGAFRVAGRLDIDALEQAIRRLEQRHPALRAVFPFDEEPHQRIEAAGRVELQRLAADELSQWMTEPFDLSEGPAVRVGLASRTDVDHRLAIVAHHIVCDQPSWMTIRAELGEFYRAARARQVLPPVHEDDYAAQVRRECAATVTPGLPHDPRPVPALRPPLPPSPRHQGSGVATADLPGELAARIARGAASLGVTRFSVLLALAAALTGQLCSMDELAFTTPVSTRQPGGDDTVGCFVNLALLRVCLDLDAPLRVLVTDVHRQVTRAVSERMAPYQLVVERLRAAGAIAGGELPSVASFNLIDEDEGDAPDLEGTVVTVHDSPAEDPRNDLSFTVRRVDGGLRLRVRYNPRVVLGEAVDRLVASYPVVADRATRSWSDPVSAIIGNTSLARLPYGLA